MNFIEQNRPVQYYSNVQTVHADFL